MQPSRPSSQYFPLLDGIRGLAAVAVMFRHMQPFGVHAVAQSYLGVDIFFALSGAVIASAYERKLLSGMRTRDFFWRRVVRLWPMIALGVALGVVNAIWGQPRTPANGYLWLYAAIALVVAGNNPLLPMINLDPPSWTMSFELAVNLVYAKLVRRLTGRVILVTCGACALILGYAARRNGGLDTGGSPDTAVFGAARAGFAFFLGVGLYRLYRTGRLPIPASLHGGRGMGLCALLLGLCLFAPVPHAWRWASAFLSALFLVPAIVSLGLVSQVGGRAAKACLALGALSYPLYMINNPLATLVAANLTHYGRADLLPVARVLFAVTVPLLAWAVHRWVDEPVRSWLAGLRISRSPQTAPVGVE
jgi:peptidoglycan/LPS O-acetylase OafA/YrhL